MRKLNIFSVALVATLVALPVLAPVMAGGSGDGFFAFSFFSIFFCCIFFCAWAIPAILAYIVYQDAVKNSVDSPILWGLLTFFTGWIGLLVYFLAIRPDAIKRNA